MDIFTEILNCCTPAERDLLTPVMRAARDDLGAVGHNLYNRYTHILADAEIATQKRRDASGWYDERTHGKIHFKDAPSYAMRSQDLRVSDELQAKDRAAEKAEALAKRQAQWSKLRRQSRKDWLKTLARRSRAG